MQESTLGQIPPGIVQHRSSLFEGVNSARLATTRRDARGLWLSVPNTSRVSVAPVQDSCRLPSPPPRLPVPTRAQGGAGPGNLQGHFDKQPWPGGPPSSPGGQPLPGEAEDRASPGGFRVQDPGSVQSRVGAFNTSLPPYPPAANQQLLGVRVACTPPSVGSGSQEACAVRTAGVSQVCPPRTEVRQPPPLKVACDLLPVRGVRQGMPKATGACPPCGACLPGAGRPQRSQSSKSEVASGSARGHKANVGIPQDLEDVPVDISPCTSDGEDDSHLPEAPRKQIVEACSWSPCTGMVLGPAGDAGLLSIARSKADELKPQESSLEMLQRLSVRDMVHQLNAWTSSAQEVGCSPVQPPVQERRVRTWGDPPLPPARRTLPPRLGIHRFRDGPPFQSRRTLPTGGGGCRGDIDNRTMPLGPQCVHTLSEQFEDTVARHCPSEIWVEDRQEGDSYI